jgi:alkylation response protein AidB-like acyl-CoA dehydrogenase
MLRYQPTTPHRSKAVRQVDDAPKRPVGEVHEGAAVDFELTYEQQAVRDLADRLSLDCIGGAARAAERAGSVPRDVWAKVAATGMMPAVPQEYGGGGLLDPLTLTLVVEALAHGDAAIATALAWSSHAALLIARCGTAAQQSRHLAGFAFDPDTRGAVACHEGFGRAPSEYQTRIGRGAAGAWRVVGRKLAVVHGAGANPLIVVGKDPADDRLRAAVVCASDPGVTLRSGAAMIGLEAAPTASLAFDLTVAEDQLLGGVDADPIHLARSVAEARLTTASLALGCAQCAREYASEYARGRVAFGRPIAGFQGVAFMMADAEVQINAGRLEVWDVASRLDTMPPNELESAVGAAIAYAGAVAAKIARDCVQVLGGHGFICDHPVELWYRSTAALNALDFDVTRSSFIAAL